MTTYLGPVSPAQRGLNVSPCSLCYNGRCLVLDLSSYTVATWFTTPGLLNLTLGAASASALDFQSELQGRFSDGFLGLYAAGHFTIGGDADDLFSSPIDLAFHLHKCEAGSAE